MKNQNNIPLSQEEYKEKLIVDLQSFLIYKKTTSLDYGSRLLEPFVVVGMSDNGDGIFAKFEEPPYLINVMNASRKRGIDHYWVDKKEFYNFVNGNKKLGTTLNIDKHYIDDGHIVFELRLKNNGLKADIYDAQKLKHLIIQYNNGNLYKVFDVQVKCDNDTLIDNVVRLFVTEEESAEQFINQKIVFKDNLEATKGPGMSIILSGPNTQEEFVRKNDAIKAVNLERKNTIKEVFGWLQSFANQNVPYEMYQNIEELKIKFVEKFN